MPYLNYMVWLKFLFVTVAAMTLGVPAQPAKEGWNDVDAATLAQLNDDDLARHAADTEYLKGLSVSQIRFSESGFDWQLIRFVNRDKPVGPLWAVPHDDENAAFEAAIQAVKQYGGVAVVVNSGAGSSRMQPGMGTCGGRPAIASRCDPNRNFSSGTPLYTHAFLDQLPFGQPIIALHTNNPGFGSGLGDITMLDAQWAAKGTTRVRMGGHFGKATPPPLDNYDTYAIIPYQPPAPTEADISCRNALVESGVHVWHERVGASDGSLSNYVVQNLPSVPYVNMESRRESDIALAAGRHTLMIDAYIGNCVKPAP